MLPAAVAGWSHESDAATWLTAPDALTQSLELRYRRGAQRVQATIVQTLATDAKLPALRALAGAGGHWREARTEVLRHCDGARCAAFVHVTLQGRPAGQRRHVYAAYCADALITESTLAFRAAHAWHRVTGQTGDRRAIALAIDGERCPPTMRRACCVRCRRDWGAPPPRSDAELAARCSRPGRLRAAGGWGWSSCCSARGLERLPVARSGVGDPAS